MIKTYGKLELISSGLQWKLSDIMPHVAIRLKQLFPRIPKWKTGSYLFPNDSKDVPFKNETTNGRMMFLVGHSN